MKVALVTGSSGLIGSALVESYLEADYRVIGLDITDTDKFSSSNYFFYKLDLLNLGQVAECIKDISRKFDAIDCIVNNASTRPDGFFQKSEEYNLDSFEKVLAVNLTANLAISSGLFQLLLKAAAPSIVNISSIYGLRAPDFSIYPKNESGELIFTTPVSYSVAKSAIVGLTKHLAAEWGQFGIRVNAVAPGGIENSQEKGFIERYTSITSLNRMCKVEDVVNLVLFLTSHRSTYITGQTIPVDGGWTL